MAFPALAFIIGMIPGFFWIYDPDTERYAPCNFFNAPPSSVMSTFCPLLVIGIVYVFVLTFCYFRSQSLGMIKAVFVFSVTVCILCALMLIPTQMVTAMPYGLMVILWGVMSLISFIRMKSEIARYDFG